METREIILDILQEMHEDIDYEKEKASRRSVIRL